jgi:hypothetical protein
MEVMGERNFDFQILNGRKFFLHLGIKVIHICNP